jgi:hypothetical protein
MCKYSTLINAAAILKQSDESRRLTGINILAAASEIVGAFKIESKVCSSIDWMIQRYNSTKGAQHFARIGTCARSDPEHLQLPRRDFGGITSKSKRISQHRIAAFSRLGVSVGDSSSRDSRGQRPTVNEPARPGFAVRS